MRFIALAIDMMIVAFFSGMVFIAALSGYHMGAGQLTFPGLSCILFISSIVSFFIFLFYFTYLTMEEGATIGKSIAGIRVIIRNRIGVGMRPGFVRSLVRAVAYILSVSACFLGFLMALVFRGWTLHDIIAGTQVVRADAEEEP